MEELLKELGNLCRHRLRYRKVMTFHGQRFLDMRKVGNFEGAEAHRERYQWWMQKHEDVISKISLLHGEIKAMAA